MLTKFEIFPAFRILVHILVPLVCFLLPISQCDTIRHRQMCIEKHIIIFVIFIRNNVISVQCEILSSLHFARSLADQRQREIKGNRETVYRHDAQSLHPRTRSTVSVTRHCSKRRHHCFIILPPLIMQCSSGQSTRWVAA